MRLAALSRGEAPPVGDEPSADAARPAKSGTLAPSPQPVLTESALALEQRLLGAHLEPPRDSELDPGDLAAVRAAGRAVRVSKTLHYHPQALAHVRTRVLQLAADGGGLMTLARLRDELGISRKFAQALLEHLDAERVTIRRGGAHYLRKASSSESGG